MVLLSALSLTLLASLVSSTPTPSSVERSILPIRKSNVGISAKELVDHGLARIAHYNGHPASDNTKRYGSGSGVVTNQDFSYVASVTACDHTYKLIVDTGSSNLWIGAGGSIPTCPGSRETGNTVSVQYGSGSFSGNEWTGRVSFAGLTVHKQSFGIATTATGFQNVDGILGLGPVDLTEGTVSNVGTVPTFADNLLSQREIKNEVIGVFFKPERGSDNDDANGELTFGGTDPTKYTGPISYFPRTHISPFSYYWGISGVYFIYGHRQLINTPSSVIVDTGTTLILIPSDAYTTLAARSGGIQDASGFLSYTTEPTKNFALDIKGETFTLTPNQYLVPQAQYSNYGLQAGKYYSWISNGGAGNVDCLIGQKFLENYYSVFDTTRNRIGFASKSGRSW